MNCEGWRIEIAASLDGSSDPRMAAKVRHHLDTCSSCLEFYREQSELTALLGSPALEVEPPESLWYRIENRMRRHQEEPAIRTFLAGLFRFRPAPRLRYALVSTLLLLVASWSLLQFKNDRDADQDLLARIDACQLKVQGNPFLSRLEGSAPADNPFLTLGASTSNPFETHGSLQ